MSSYSTVYITYLIIADKMSTRLPLDYLLDELQTPSQSSSLSNTAQPNIQNQTNENVAGNLHINNRNETQTQDVGREMSQNGSVSQSQCPSQINQQRAIHFVPDASNLTPNTYSKRLRLITKNLSSCSLRKYLFKPVHCKFCSKYKLNRSEIESHLKQSETCLNLYLRHLRVNELNAVLVKLFRCLHCGSNGNFQLKRHFEANINCFQYYKEKFNVLTLQQIQTKIANLTRPSNASRSVQRRRLENSQQYDRRRLSTTVTAAFNAFQKQTCLGIFKLQKIGQYKCKLYTLGYCCLKLKFEVLIQKVKE